MRIWPFTLTALCAISTTGCSKPAPEATPVRANAVKVTTTFSGGLTLEGSAAQAKHAGFTECTDIDDDLICKKAGAFLLGVQSEFAYVKFAAPNKTADLNSLRYSGISFQMPAGTLNKKCVESSKVNSRHPTGWEDVINPECVGHSGADEVIARLLTMGWVEDKSIRVPVHSRNFYAQNAGFMVDIQSSGLISANPISDDLPDYFPTIQAENAASNAASEAATSFVRKMTEP